MVRRVLERIVCLILRHVWRDGPAYRYCEFCDKTKQYPEVPYDVYSEVRENGDVVFKMRAVAAIARNKKPQQE